MALTLGRKVGQTIQIGSNIFVTVIRVRGDNLRIDVKAPIEIPITRCELEEYAFARKAYDQVEDSKYRTEAIKAGRIIPAGEQGKQTDFPTS